MKFSKKIHIIFLIVTFLFLKQIGCNNYQIDWDPSGNYLAVTRLYYVYIYSLNRDMNSLTYTDSKYVGSPVTAAEVSWSKDGKYVAAGTFVSATNKLQIFGVAASYKLGSVLAGYEFNRGLWWIDWHPLITSGSTKYCLAVATASGPVAGTDELTILQYDGGTTLSVTDSRNISGGCRNVKFHSSGNYLAVAATSGNSPNLLIYKFNSSTRKIINGSPFASKSVFGSAVSTEGLAWSPDGRYLAVSGVLPGAGLYIYRFYSDDNLPFDSRLQLLDWKAIGTARQSCVDWSPSGDYIAVSADGATGGYELQVYQFDTKTEKLSEDSVGLYDYTDLSPISWTSDSRFIALGVLNSDNIFTTLWSYYKQLGLYRFDGSTYNAYQDVNTILKNGDNARGSVAFKKGVTIPVGAGIKLDIDEPICTYLDLRTTGSITLNGDLFLDANLSVSSGGIIGLNNKSLILNGDIQIQPGSVLEFDSNGVFDGQGHNVVLGKYSQLLVDGGVTVTFKNMTIKNTLNTISCPPICCMDWYSQACFDNVTFAFNDDWAFRNGQFFIHNDVEFTGTSKFSYRSVRPSYIASHSNLIFDPQTTFEYYPSTTDNALINMQDKTSSIIFDGSTLQSTHTGIRLTKGSIYFDNKVTLSSAGDKALVPFYITSFSVNSSDFKTLGVEFSPDGKFLAIATNGADGSPRNIIYQLQGNSFSFVCYVDNTPGVMTKQISWSPNGKYLAVSKNGTSTICSFNGSSCSNVCSIGSSADTWWIDWSPDGKYLAKANTDGNECDVYSFNGTSCTLTCSVESSVQMWSIKWHPNGKYLATGEYSTPCKVYRFDGSVCKFVCNINTSAHNTKQASWSPDGRFIALGNYNVASEIYYFTGKSANQVATTASAPSCRASWSPNGKYIVFPNSHSTTSLYSFDGSSLVNLCNLQNPSADDDANSASWTPDGTVVVIGIYPNSSYAYKLAYQYDTASQGFSSGIVFGDSAVGASQDLDAYLLSAARVGIYGKVLQDSVNSSWNFQSRDSYVSLDRYDSQFKITNANSVENWKKNQIVKSSQDNTIFLQDNQIWATNMNQLAPEETFEFMNNLVIPDGQLVELSANAVIDGQGHDLILGKYAQLLVDGGVTVTFKNMTIKNTLNTISCPPILCMDWYSQACFDNVTFAFNDDWAFRNGQFFIHNDVEFTGTSKFSYRSVRPSYIASHSNLIFDPQTTFEYYPSTTDNALIKMADKTSSIIFDGSTLQTTSTGIRLAKGSVYFDNKVTLSSVSSGVFGSAISLGSFDSGYDTWSVAWSPDGRYLATGNYNNPVKIYSFDGTMLSFVCQGSYINQVTKCVTWSPDGKYLAASGHNYSGTWNPTRIYKFDGTSLTMTSSTKPYKNNSIDWSPDGKYLVTASELLPSLLYRFQDEKLIEIFSTGTAVDSDAVKWHPGGKFVMIAGWSGGTNDKLYRVDGEILTLVQTLSANDSSVSIAWSPNGKYLIIGNADAAQTDKLYRFENQQLSLIYEVSKSNTNWSVSWSPDGHYILFADYSGGTRLYRVDGERLTLIGTNFFDTNGLRSAGWSPDGKFVCLGGRLTYNKAYKLSYMYDTSPQGFSNGIAFGNSAVGTTQDLDVYLLAAARVGIYGKVLQDSVNSSWNFQSRDSYVSLDRYDSQFKITNANSVENWKKNQIVKSSQDNTIFLQDNQVWTTNMDQLAPEETFEFMNDLIIQDGQTLQFSANAVIDGQGHDLILGKYSQLLVDGGVTVTFKNMTIKNTLNTISCPPIRCMDWYGKVCFDNVTFAFNDDWAFRNGQFFIHNDVNFTGTSKFSYRSIRPSYIASDSNFIFNPLTTFEYYPSTIDNTLIKMTDKTSSIVFDESSLQTTHTGIRFTKGSIYFDNKITLSSADNTLLSNLLTATQTFGNRNTYGIAWSPDGNYLALGNADQRTEIYKFNNGSLYYITSTPSAKTTRAISWSPNGKYLALGNNGQASDIYFFNGSSLSYITSTPDVLRTSKIAWTPDGKYLAVSDYSDYTTWTVYIYSFDGTSLNYITKTPANYQVGGIAWSPDGKYFINQDTVVGTGAVIHIYSFNGLSLNTIASISFGDSGPTAIDWSPDQKYLAFVSGNYIYIYSFNVNSISYITSTAFSLYSSAMWSPDGKYLAVGTSGYSTGMIYSFNGSSLTSVASLPVFCGSIAWAPDGKYLALGIAGAVSQIYPINYRFDTFPQGYSNGIAFGNSALGPSNDADVNIMGGARINVFGKVWFDNLN